MRHSRPFVLSALLLALFGFSGSGLAGSFDLEFNQDGVLPSSQGFTYETGFGGPVLDEKSVFSVTGGSLHMNTLGTSGVAIYSLPQGGAMAYKASSDASLEWSMRGNSIGQVGFSVLLNDGVGPAKGNIYVEFSFGSTIQFDTRAQNTPGGSLSSIPFNSVDGLFHTYRLTTSAADGSFKFFIDPSVNPNPVKTGSLGPGSTLTDSPESIYFGDATTSGGDASVVLDYIRFVNVPEPGVCMLAPAFAVFLMMKRRRAIQSASAFAA